MRMTLVKENLIVRTDNDISEALNAGMSTGGLILNSDQLATEFFDLKTGLAGELFQKYTNYPTACTGSTGYNTLR